MSDIEQGSDLGRQLNEARATIGRLNDQRGLALRIEALRAAATACAGRETPESIVALAEQFAAWLEGR